MEEERRDEFGGGDRETLVLYRDKQNAFYQNRLYPPGKNLPVIKWFSVE